MAAILNSQSRSLTLLRKQFFNSNSQPHSTPRWYSSQNTNPHNENNDNNNNNNNKEPNHQSVKLKPKKKKAKAMARLINSNPWSNDLETSLSDSLSKTIVLQVLRLIATPSKAFQFFKWVQQMGFSHTAQSYFMMLEILGRHRNLNVARNFLFSIDKRSNGAVKLEDRFFNSLIRNYGRAGLFQESIKLFSTMKSLGVSPSVVSFNSLLSILLKRGRTNMAKSVYDEMLTTYGVTPDTYTFNILIRGFCVNTMVDEGFHFFKEMSRFKCEPDVVTYNTLVDGLAGNLDEALKMFDKMSELQVQSDSATYSVIIRSLCQIGDYGRAEELFDELSEKEILFSAVGCKPLVAAYNPMFEYLCGNGKTKKAERVFRQLMKRGTQDPPSYKTLIMGHCREGTYEAGYELLVWMLRRDFVPDVEIYESLIDGFMQKGKPLLAQQTLEKMLKSSHVPKTETFHSIFAELLEMGCAHESASSIMLMLEKKIRQNVNLSTKCTRLLFGSGLKDKAFQIVGLIYENGYSVKMEELVGFLCQNRKLLDAHEMLLFALDKDQSIDTDMCNTVILGLCKMNKLSEAFGLYYEMVEKGVNQNLTCLYDLKTALDAGGRSQEAGFVSKRIPEHGHLDRPAPSPKSSSEKSRPQKLPFVVVQREMLNKFVVLPCFFEWFTVVMRKFRQQHSFFILEHNLDIED
ncbi:pentatricopeptide repeat-containing protein [Quercus suber]|uniref:Pentatricopeptide repeat-containing protein n=1 Tax=Quercus suber TaxID=58331 RepID=A0AAW0KXQ3_QUESU